MTADSLIEVVQDAVDATGMETVPVQDRTRLLSDNGSGYVSRAFREYVQVVGIRHILAPPFHPQTNGKLERYHRTLKDDVNQVPYEVVEDLEAAIRGFVGFYNDRRYHKALRDVTPADVLEGRREAILAQGKEVQRETFERRRLSGGPRNPRTRSFFTLIPRVQKCPIDADTQHHNLFFNTLRKTISSKSPWDLSMKVVLTQVSTSSGQN